MLPREFISHWLHRCLPARWEEVLMPASWTWVRHQLSAHASLVAPFCPVCVTKMTEETTFILSQDLWILRTSLSRPCSALKVLLEKVELRRQQPICTFDLWRRLKKIPSLVRICSIKYHALVPLGQQKHLLEKHAEDCTTLTCPNFCPRDHQSGRVPPTCFSMKWVSPPAKALRTRLWCSFS